MPADKVPTYVVPLQNADGTMNVTWWKFFARLAAQFSGADAPLMPVDGQGILSISNAQGQTAAPDRDTRDLALIASRPEIYSPASTEALDLAAIALSRIRPAVAAQASSQILICTQATFPTLAGMAATFVWVSDYAHWIYWDGTTPTFADDGSDYYVLGQRASGSPGWHLVDGTVTSYLKADGTLAAKVLPAVAALAQYSLVTQRATADGIIAAVAASIASAADGTGTPSPFFALTPTTYAEPQAFSSVLWYRQ